MASGRKPRNKSASSEPRLRSTWLRSTSMSDKEDNLSIHSIPNELRPNNWDFSNWKPSAPLEQTKRRKKENPEREREQSLSHESPPPSERRHTSLTFPRTRVVPGASGPQKNGLEPLRQHITFSDADEASLDDERNNERVMPRRRDRSLNFTRQDTSERVNIDAQTRLGRDSRIINQTPVDRYNNNEDKDDGPESSQIIGRLMLIRDYIKQAYSMMESLRNSGDPQANREELDRVQKLASHLKDQELAYMDLLQRVFASKDNGYMVDGPLFRRDTTPAMESIEDTSVDLDVQSETSETTTERSPNGSSRPRIEDKLGLDSDEEDEVEDMGEMDNQDSDSSESETMDSTVVSTSRPEWDFEDGVGNDLEGQDELSALRKQQELLKKLIHQQEQMKALKERQAALLAMQQDAEQRLGHVRTSDLNEATQNIPEHDTDGASLPPGLLEIRQQLNVLRNELKVQTPDQDKKQKNEMGSSLPVSQQELRNKLGDLQDKKQHMDMLITELRCLRSSRYDQFVNNKTVAEATHFKEHVHDGAAVSNSAGNTAHAAEDVLEIMEARQKLGSVDNHRPSQSRKPVEETAQRIPDGQADEHESSSDSESKLSSLGPWGDDPEIQEKVKKLRDAKEKLKQLQDLVSAVQQSPDAVRAISDSVADVTRTGDQVNQAPADVSVSEGEVTAVQAANNSFYESKMQEQLQELEELRQERHRLLAVQDQLHKLHEQFVDEPEENPKRNLAKKKPVPPPPEQIVPDTTSSQQNGPTVTFSSNEEVYNKMRKQRLFREELRQKKQELEAIMKKDRNKRQYSRNQDNQSDTVSYTTDAFGASQSADITVATWGGSTVDNLESITEGDNADAANNTNDEDEDDYPSDGIVQVEEEEEENETDSKSYSMSDDRRQMKDRKPSSQSRLTETYPQSTRTNKGKKSRSQDTWPGRKRPSSAWPRRTEKHGSRSGEKIDGDDDSRWSHGNIRNSFQQQLEQMSSMCQNMLLGSTGGSAQILPASWSPSSGSSMRPSGISDLQQQLQQQQMLMSMNQCYQQMAMHQMEIQNMQRQMHNMSQQIHDQSDWDLRNDSGDPEEPLLRPFPSTANRPQSAGYPQRNRNFSVQPQFPSDFHLRRSRDNIPGHTHGDDSVFENERTRAPSSTRLEGDGGLQGDFRYSSSAPYNISPITPHNDNGVQDRLKTADSLSGPDCWYPSTSTQKQKSNTLAAIEPDDAVPKIDIQQLLNRMERRKRSEVGVEHSAARTNKQRSDVVHEISSVEGRSEPRVGDVGEAKLPPYRPGLSAGISGTSYMDSLSTTSNASSAAVSGARAEQSRKGIGRPEDQSGISLFEALRETIYSEVATLISQNENRPHFLIEMFRELQLLTSDYLRQRVLYAIKDVVSKFLVEENNELSMATPPLWMNIPNDMQSASELTPSENNVPTDEEEEARKAVKVRNPVMKRVFGLTGSLDNDQFDYAENAENDSPLSTPSNSYWESPFAKDSLGDTVIHLDKALERMREYEKRTADLKARTSSHNEMQQELNPRNLESKVKGVAVNISEPTEVSADQGSESSEPMYPCIDTQQLDQQIKGIMTELIPVIKEHMDNICSLQLLAYIKRLVLSLTRQPSSNQEFTRFFHRQLGSILQDALTKFEGRKMRECGEDLLVDLSEVLFNELAFSRLMQDLNDPMLADKIRDTAQMDGDLEDDREEVEGTGESDTTENSTVNNDGEIVSTKLTLGAEEEDLGKARDDELANSVQIKENDDKDDDTDIYEASAVQIELAVSETKPFTRIGSDEDDDDADESPSADDLSETAVSRSAKMENCTEQNDRVEVEQVQVMNGRQEPLGDASPSEPVSVDGASEGDADQGARAEPSEKMKEKSEAGLLNGNAVNLSDLPSSLTVLSQEELQRELAEEQTDSVGAAGILANLPDSELVGYPQYLRTPDGDASR